MKLVTVEEENFEAVTHVQEKVFNVQLGTLPSVQHIQTRPEARVVVMANHRVPIALVEN